MTRPILKIERDTLDQICDFFGLISICLLILLPFYYYSSLPDQIAIQYNYKGMPKGFGEKKYIWTLPVVGLFLYLMMIFLNRFPHIFNYPQKVTRENAFYLYTNATKMMRFLKTIIIVAFTYIMLLTIQIAMGTKDGLGIYFTPFILVFTFGIIGYFLYRLLKVEKSI